MQKDTVRWAHITSLVERYRDHPALMGWYTADDTTFYYRDNMRLLYTYIKSMDPHHPVFVTLSGYDGAYIYSGCYVRSQAIKTSTIALSFLDYL